MHELISIGRLFSWLNFVRDSQDARLNVDDASLQSTLRY